MSPESESYPELRTVFAAFETCACIRPNNIALISDGGRGRQYTYADVLETARSLATGLQSGKLSDCLEIGLLSENRPEWPIAYLAILAAGKTVVPIDTSLKPNEIAALIDHAGLKAIIVSGKYETIISGFDSQPTVISFEENSPNNWQKIFGDPKALTVAGTGDDMAVLIYTSGTTGTPKAVMLTHGNLLSNLNTIRVALKFDEQDVFLSLLPLYHTFEATCGFLTPLTTGCRVVYARSLKSREIAEDIQFNNVTVMCGVPLLYEKMYQSMQRGIQAVSFFRRFLFYALFALSGLGWRLGRKWGRVLFGNLRDKAGMRHVRMFVSGSAALPRNIARFFCLIGFDMLEGYGMTECSPVISANRPNDIRFGSVGPPLDGVSVTIDDPDSDSVGEILVKGGNVTPGYKGNPEQTAELLRDGWLHTGDLGRLDKGHLFICGRAKNLIISAAGKNIYPEELEEKLMASRYLLEALVFGRARVGKQGEEVRALLVPDIEQFRAEFSMSVKSPDRKKVLSVLKDVVEDVNQQIADYKRIVGFDMQFEELEKTSTKKVKRFLYTKQPGKQN